MAIVLPEESRSATHMPFIGLPEISTDFTVSDTWGAVVGIITVNCDEAELDAASLAIIVWGPAVGAGSVNVAAKLPVELVVIILGAVVTNTPSYDMETPEFEWKLLPVTVMVLLGAPVVGLSDIAGVVATVVAEAVLDGELAPTELIADTR